MAATQTEIPGTKGKYIFTSNGKIRSLLWPNSEATPYLYNGDKYVTLQVEKESYKVPLAMVIYMTYVNPKLKLKDLADIDFGFVDRNKANFKPENIFIKRPEVLY